MTEAMSVGIDHRGSNAEQHAGDEPPSHAAGRRRQEQPTHLHPHAGYDQAFASVSIAQGAGDGLEQPRPRDGSTRPTYSRPCEPVGREKEREDAPTHSVVQIVDEPGLGCREQVAIAKTRCAGRLPRAVMSAVGGLRPAQGQTGSPVIGEMQTRFARCEFFSP